MDIFPNECIYTILLFLNPKQLQLCAQLNNNFHRLYQLDSLWRNQIENKYNVLFKKEKYYENCKLYYRLNTFRRQHKLYQSIGVLYKLSRIRLFYINANVVPEEIEQLLQLLNGYKLDFDKFIALFTASQDWFPEVTNFFEYEAE